MELTAAGKIPKPSPNFWLVDGTGNRISEEFSAAGPMIDYATRQALFGRPEIKVGASYVTCGRVPLDLFGATYRQGLLPENATLLHFNVAREIRFKRPLVATEAELLAIEAGTLTQLRRPAEYIGEIYKRGQMKGQPKFLHYPTVNSMVDWTQQELLLAHPCYYGQPGETLCFSEAPDAAFKIERLSCEQDSSGRRWDWVLDLARL